MKKSEQTFQNYNKALASLEKALATPAVEDRDYAGIVQNFEFTYELLWKTLKAFLEENGITAPFPRVVFEQAYKAGLIEGNEIWKDIMEARNLTVHTYDHAFAVKLCSEIQQKYLGTFQKTRIKLKQAMGLNP